MNERIIDFVRSCPDSQQNKDSCHQPYRLSSLLHQQKLEKCSQCSQYFCKLY